MAKSNTGDLDGGTIDYVYDQTAGSSANKADCLDDQIGTIKTAMNRNDRNGKEINIKSSDGCIYDQNSGIVSAVNANSNVDGECDEDLNVGPANCAVDKDANLSSGKLLHQHTFKNTDTNLIYREVCIDDDCEDLDVVSNDSVGVVDQHSGLSLRKAEDLHGNDIKATNSRLLQSELLNQGANGLEEEPMSEDVNILCDQTLDGNEDGDVDDHYNRFYFESDHLALKDNKHYQLLLQTLLVLESQRTQAVKDLDILYEQQAKALQDPVSFVEKLQNNQLLNLPSRQKVVKLPSIPWELYTVSLSAIDRQRLNNPHHTRAAALQSLAKASESATDASDGGENMPVSSESNVYSVFGGEFVASKRGKPLGRESLTSVFTPRGSEGRSRLCDEIKPVTFNQPWTTEEQAKLEKLLQIYPQEEVESKRWEKISAALGNRTVKQVASRVQKYFIKLAKSGLPVPGRMPNLPRTGMRSKRSSHHYQTLGFRNSTFFPSYRPKVLMDEDDDTSSIATDDMAAYVSDDESVPAHLRETDEYRELMELKRLKKQKIADYQQTEEGVLHSGFMCDGCGISPISGTRWHCNDCSKNNSVDFCTECVERGNLNVGSHTSEHSLEPVNRNSSFFMDGDYVGLSEGSTSAGYNYLDPNFLPSAR